MDIAPFRDWFSGYVQGFFRGGPSFDEHIALKRDHTWRVLQEAERITASLDIAQRLARLIELSALVHDIGRFPQLRDFGTFDDSRSVNHGLLGFRTLRREGLLESLDPAARKLVLQTVLWHNRPSLPSGIPPDLDCALKAVRDADKLDIYRVVISHLQAPGPKDETVTLGLRDDPEAYNPAIVERVMAGRGVRYEQMGSVNDFALLLCSWSSDLNFEATRRAVLKRGYMADLCSLLPDAPPIRQLQAELFRRLETGGR